MDVTHRIPWILGLLAAVLAAPSLPAWSTEDARPPIDREEHETVKTATFALG